MVNRAWPGVSAASAAPTAPGVAMAVATPIAPSTPMASCTRTGMNVRVQIVPPASGGATRVTFGTVVPPTSPSPISLPARRRRDSTR
jgi:hypothetical protein